MEPDPQPSEPVVPASGAAGPPDQDHDGGGLLGSGAVAFLTLGVAAAVSLVAGAGIGYLVDEWVGTSPLFTLLGLALGLVIATLMTIDRVRKYL